MAVTKNQEYTVTIEGYSGEGAGVARIDGFVVFVSGALRGEVCRILILKVLKSAAFAKVLEVLEPSPHRITPDCPYFPRCGGCTYRHMDYAEELALKRRRVQDNLARIGGSEVEVEEILGAAETRRYRNKAQYPVSPDGKVGFYRARTHEVIDTRECLLVKPEADAAAEAVRQYMRDFRAAGYDERTGRGLLRHVYVRSNTRGECLICLLVNGKRLPHEAELVERLRRACPKAVGIVLGENTRRDNVILGERYRTLWGADRLEDVLCGRVFRLSVPSSARRSCRRPSTTRGRTPRAAVWKMPNSSAATPPTWQKNSRRRICGPTSSRSIRRARGWRRTWWKASRGCSPSAWCMSPATARRWRAM